MLVIDDCPFNVCALQGLLEQFNLQSDTACNGLEAIRRLQTRFHKGLKPYELILMDYSMPQCDGLETTQRMRAIFNERQVERAS